MGRCAGASSVQETSQLEIGGRARAEAHIEHMVHVRDTGGVETQWLVECRLLPSGKGAHKKSEVLPVYGRAWGNVRAQAACRRRANWRSEAGHARRRTENVKRISVTLEVLRLSGWLNADAPCQVESGKYEEGEMPRVCGKIMGRCAGASNVQETSQLEIGGQARAEAHMEHGAHFRDPGGVETQRLVERRRHLPSAER